jgi:REP element-mobilizing transposase RayT
MKTIILEPGKFYHIYNRAKNGKPLFSGDEDIQFFLRLYKTHVLPVADTWAYCIMKDHVHFLIRIRDDRNGNSYKPFALLFNSYAKGFNTRNECTGKVFRYKLKRAEIRREMTLREVVRYINQNPRKHGVVEQCEQYRYSSFRATVSPHPTLIARQEIQDRFGNYEMLRHLLTEPVNEKGIKMYLLED